ncbi:PAS sensor protein [Desulfurispirillum indicum S5]|uniref:histidine kinase n=1 Tax=Desulfurispirillum indicum (strain ATCC BAA-1389 / DSM 22839 / S5) TaxID=653733 RepID=E6W4A4_DESIS|nr:PAS domain S-box protein [Desulfurispirillum indicum]ADU65878.1 PAS sensor protein [Desulfurispirillum indicum S5]
MPENCTPPITPDLADFLNACDEPVLFFHRQTQRICYGNAALQNLLGISDASSSWPFVHDLFTNVESSSFTTESARYQYLWSKQSMQDGMVQLTAYVPRAHPDYVLMKLHIDERFLQRFEQCLHFSGDGLWEWELLSGTVYLSPRWKEIAGYSDGELENSFASWRQVIHPDDYQRAIERIRSLSQFPGRVFQVVHRILSKSGTFKWVLCRGQVLPGPDGKAERIIGFLTDIDEQRKIEEELEQARQMLLDVQSRVSMGNWEMDLETEQFWWSDEMYRIFNVSAGDFGGSLNDFLAMIIPEEQPLVEQVFRGDVPFSHFFTFHTDPVGPRTVYMEAEIYRNAHGTPTRMVGLAQDVTAQREAQQQNSKLSRALEQVPNAVIITDREGTIEYINPAFEQITGYTREEVIGRNPNVLNSSSMPREFYRDMWQQILNGSIFEGELVNRRKDGTLYQEHKSIAPIRDTRGHITHFVSIGRDITQQVQMQREIEAANQTLQELNEGLQRRVEEGIEKQRRQEQLLLQQSRLGAMAEMMSYVAHHWRQPLNIIGLLIQNIQIAHQMNELNSQFIEDVSRQSMEQIRKMSEVIDSFASFSQESRDKQPFSLVHAIQDTLLLVQQQLQDSGITIQATFVPTGQMIPVSQADTCPIDPHQNNYPAVNVLGYPNEFKHVLLSIINNARDAIASRFKGSGQGFIDISLDHNEQEIVVRIADTGMGIDAAIMDRIFDPYFTTKDVGKGTGIALYMAKVIIETHMGGQLTAQNTNEGACFTIRFHVPAQVSV